MVTRNQKRHGEVETTVSGFGEGFCDRLKWVVEKRIGTHKKAGEIAGLKPEMIGKYIAGRAKPSFFTVAALAKAADVSIDWIASGDDPPVVAAGMPDVRTPFIGPSDQAGFVLVPRYDVEASAGPGAFAETEDVVDFMAFREDWVRRTLRVDPASLVLITAVGDSMEPAIRAGDLLLVDRSVDRILDDAIYVLAIAGRLIVKRVQQFLNGAVTIKSDSDSYVDETIAPEEIDQIRVAGRVRWIGRLI